MNHLVEQKKHTLEKHVVIQPSILYAGNPVALITTLNSNGDTNISPMSSAITLALAPTWDELLKLKRDHLYRLL